MEINGHDATTGEEIDWDYDRMRDAGYKLNKMQWKMMELGWKH